MTNRLLMAAVMVAPAVLGAPAAIVNKQLGEHGHQTFATPAAIADDLFGGSARVKTGLAFLVALVLLGALVATLTGIWQTLRGQRGGVELLSSGVFGVVVLTAGVTVVM